MAIYIQKNKFILYLSFLLILFFVFFIFNSNIEEDREIKQYCPIVLIYNPDLYSKYGYILKVYEQTLKEEGINFKVISCYEFLKLPILNVKGVIFPDSINQNLPPDFYFLANKLLKKGVNIFLSYDVGIKDKNMKYLKNSIFTNILGINYITYYDKKDFAFLTDNIKFINPDFISFPLYKLDDNLTVVKYKYPAASYYVANVEVKDRNYIEIAKSEKYNLPIIVLKKKYEGFIYYVNSPVGYLKAYSDDLILRTNINTFLYKVCKVSGISNLEYGIPTLIMNYHIDSNVDWKSIEFLYSNNYFRKNMRISFHITAGDFLYKEGDKLGFDACGNGKKYVELLKNYGEIGSHGGWAHNFFSYSLIYNPENKYDFIKKYIIKNNQCLEQIIGYKVVEYSAPNGVHPQPVNTKVLEELGMVCYYYTGDLGSQPNLTFFNGKKVSDKVLAFPVVPYRSIVSLGEMKKNYIPAEKVKKFLIYLVDYIIESKTVRLYYTHPYDIMCYPNEYLSFLDYIENKIKYNQIQFQTMKDYTDFFFRFLNTTFDIKSLNNRLVIELYNPESLKGICFKLSKSELKNITKSTKNYLKTKGIFIKEDEYYWYFIVMKDCRYMVFSL